VSKLCSIIVSIDTY